MSSVISIIILTNEAVCQKILKKQNTFNHIRRTATAERGMKDISWISTKSQIIHPMLSPREMRSIMFQNEKKQLSLWNIIYLISQIRKYRVRTDMTPRNAQLEQSQSLHVFEEQSEIFSLSSWSFQWITVFCTMNRMKQMMQGMKMYLRMALWKYLHMNWMIYLIMVSENRSMFLVSASWAMNSLPFLLLKIQSNSIALISIRFCFFLLISFYFCSSVRPCHLFFSIYYFLFNSASYSALASSLLCWFSILMFSLISRSFSARSFGSKSLSNLLSSALMSASPFS